MKRETTWGDIRKGDTVRVSLCDSPKVVLGILQRIEGGLLGEWLEVTLEGDARNRWFSPRHPVILVRRPYAEGETDATMRLEVFRAAQRVLSVERNVLDTVDSAIDELEAAIAAYKQGRS